MNIFKKIALLTAMIAAAATPMTAKADILIEWGQSFGWDDVIVIAVSMGITTTAATVFDMDVQKSESLLDQAYAGNGEKLEAIASAFGLSVEKTAEMIIDLEKEGRISAQDPKGMVETLAVELRAEANK